MVNESLKETIGFVSREMAFIHVNSIAEYEASTSIYFESIKVTKKLNMVSILSLPTDILMKVFALCDRSHVAENVRLVNRQFNTIATLVLNSDLFVLMNKFEVASRTLAGNPALANTFVTVHNEIVYAVTWRYLRFLGESYTCFYGGRLLDMFCKIFRAYKASDCSNIDVAKLQSLNNQFCTHFETVKEPSLTNSHIAESASKMVDLLECVSDKSMHGTFDIISSSPDMVHIEAAYNVGYSGITCLELTTMQSGRSNIIDKHRNLLTAVRHLVSSCNATHLKVNKNTFPPREPTPSLRGEMKITIKCPPRLVPFKVFRMMRPVDLTNMTANRGRKSNFKLRLEMKHLFQHTSWTFREAIQQKAKKLGMSFDSIKSLNSDILLI